MAVTKTTYTQSGSTTQYAIPFEVIDAADIDVYIEGVLQLQQNTASTAAADHPQVVSGEITQGTALTNYTVASNNATFTFNAAPSVGAFIVVERTTDDTLLETFVSGSTIRAQDLNNAFERVLFIAQEGVGIADEALGPAEDEADAFDALGNRISNVGDATDDDDAVNRGQLGKVITDDLIAGEGIDLTDVSGGTNSGKQVTISGEDSSKTNKGIVSINEGHAIGVTYTSGDAVISADKSTASQQGVIKLTAPTVSNGNPITLTRTADGDVELTIEDNSIDFAKIKDADIIVSGESWANNDTTIATTARIDEVIDAAITNDIGADSTGITVTNDGDGTITLGLADNSIDLSKIKATDIVNSTEQNADHDLTGDDDSIFTSLAAVRRFENYVQNTAPSGTGIGTGRVWVDVDDDLTLSVWNGSAWVGITSGGTFTNQPSVVYVDQASGDDNNDGHRISRPKATIKAAINQINAEINTSITNGGSGYVEGSYTTVALTGGNGTGLTADITVNAAGVVSAVTVNSTTTLEDYSIGDVLSASNADLGGSGSGLQITVGGTGDGQIVIVSAGTYQEAAPIQIKRRNVSIIGQALRSCIVHPTVATQGDQSDGNHALFELNSGSYIANLTLTGMQANNAGVNALDAVLPSRQGWNFAFYEDAFIVKSPYIQNCTNFSDSEIDNSDLRAHRPRGGAAGDTDSAPTGGGMLVNGETPHDNSPLRSMVADSYTHVGLNGPGVLVVNNGYAQITSSYAFFNRYHIKCLSGGQANLAASTTDFGDQALVADGRSTNAIFTSTTFAAAADQATEFFINGPTARTATPLPWHGTEVRPQSNMLVDIGGNTYPILSASNTFDADEIVSGRDYTILTVGDTDFTAIGAASNTVGVQFTATGVGTGSGTVTDDTGWRVTISRPNPNNRGQNLGLNGAVASSSAVSFFLRSQVASSGHTMEYVGSGTNYNALPENGGVPVEANQIVELNNGKVWTAVTDHNGKFKIGGNQTSDPIFEVDQQLGFVTIPTGSIAFDLASDLTPQLGGNLDVNGNTITGLANPTANDEVANKAYVDSVAGTPTQIAQLNTSVQTSDTGTDGTITFTNDGSESARFDSSGRLLLGTTSTSATESVVLQGNSSGATSYGSMLLARGTSSPANGNSLGNIEWSDNTHARSAIIRAERDGGTWSGSSLPTLLCFHTTADGASSPTERMRIDSSGRVGVGTTSPSAKLHILDAEDGGSGNTTPMIRFSRRNGGSNDAILYAVHDGSDGVSALRWDLAGSERLRIDSSGRVGVGTSSPGSFDSFANNLVLGSGSANAGLTCYSGSSSAGVINFADGTSGSALYSGFIYYNHFNDSLGFYVNYAGSNQPRLFINSSGNVGVGTTSPGASFHVAQGDARISDSGATQRLLRVANSAGATEYRIQADGNTYLYNDGYFAVTAGGGSERARIDSSGRLLVGTSSAYTGYGGSDANKFQIAGNSYTNAAASAFVFGSTTVGAYLNLGLSKNTTIGSHTAVSNNNTLGAITFNGSDGSAFKLGAMIQCDVDGTPGTNNMPSRLMFSTNGGASSATERLRIASTGAFGLSGANYGTSGQVLTSQGSGSAPQWADAGLQQGYNSVNLSGTAQNWTGIPSTCYFIQIAFQNVTWGTGNSAISFRLGDSGGVETSGYYYTNGYFGSSYTGAWKNNDSQFRDYIYVESSRTINGFFTARKSNNNMWIMHFTITDNDDTQQVSSTGYKSLSGTLDRVSLFNLTGYSFDGGNAAIHYLY